jgi:hypothetical protein
MRPLIGMNNAELARHVERLRDDVNDFCGRAAQVASALKYAGREHLIDPLYQRYSSIRDFLTEQLGQAERELKRRTRAAEARPAIRRSAAIPRFSLAPGKSDEVTRDHSTSVRQR